jgi:hypothetical protein
VSILNKNTTLGDKEDITPSATPTDIEVPITETEEQSTSEQTIKPETEVTEDTTTVKPGGIDEEAARKSRSQQRIGELIRKNQALQDELAGGKKEGEEIPTSEVSQARTSLTDTPEVSRAKDFLKNLGFVQNDEVKKSLREEISNLEAKMVLEDEHNRLNRIYDGEDGRPKYDKEAIMTHIAKSGIYNPEAAYKDLHEPELLDWAIKKANKAGGSTFTEKPSSQTTGDSGEITKESLGRILSSPEGRKWYEENREKLLSALQKGELQ